jgi:hypothetical protein
MITQSPAKPECKIMGILSIKQNLLDEIDKLTIEQQTRVLEYTLSLNQPLSPAPSDEAPEIDPDELEAVLAEDRKKIDWDEW